MSSPSPPRDVHLAAPEESVRERFRRLADEWKEQSRYLSNTAQMAMLKPYQRMHIEHESPHDVAGGIYGEVVHFMKRASGAKA